MHVIKEDLTRCPSCQFMAIRSEFMKYVSLTSIAYRNSIILKTIWYIYRLVDGGEPCPMCNNKISGNGALAVWTEPLKPKSNWSHLITCLFVFIFSTRPHSLKAPSCFWDVLIFLQHIITRLFLARVFNRVLMCSFIWCSFIAFEGSCVTFYKLFSIALIFSFNPSILKSLLIFVSSVLFSPRI